MVAFRDCRVYPGHPSASGWTRTAPRNTASDGWMWIAFPDDLLAGGLNQKIQNGSILDVETVFDGPGGFVPLHDDGGMFGGGAGLDFVM